MATYYINADTGNDTTGTGTSGNPWLKITKAVTSSVNGDTIILQTATAHYLWEATNLTGGGRIFSSASGNPANVIIGGTSGLPTAGLFEMRGGFTNSFNNLTLAFNSLNGGAIAGGSFIAVSAVAIFTNCIIHDIEVGMPNDSSGDSGMFVTDGVGAGFQFIGCLLYNLRKVTAAIAGRIFSIQASSNLTLTNNTFYWNNTGSSLLNHVLFTASAAPTGAFKNNIFQNAGTGHEFNDASAGYTWEISNNNDYFGFSANLPANAGGDISADPLFVDVGNANFNLRPTSPCIDTGTVI